MKLSTSLNIFKFQIYILFEAFFLYLKIICFLYVSLTVKIFGKSISNFLKCIWKCKESRIASGELVLQNMSSVIEQSHLKQCSIGARQNSNKSVEWNRESRNSLTRTDSPDLWQRQRCGAVEKGFCFFPVKRDFVFSQLELQGQLDSIMEKKWILTPFHNIHKNQF